MSIASSFLVGLDSCVFIEAAKTPNGLCNIILRIATQRTFRVLLVPRVELEVRREFRKHGIETQFDAWIQACDVVRCPIPNRQQLREGKAVLNGLITHHPDVRVAVSLWLIRPRYFVTANTKDRKDWNAARLRAPLGGVEIKKPRPFLKHAFGYEPPKKTSAPASGHGS